MSSCRIVVLIVALLGGVVAAEDFPRAETENGPVVGTYETSYSGHKYLAFRGIPYAKPPVDDNRFKEPQRLGSKWIGEWNAKNYGSVCLQVDHFTRTKLENGSLYFHTLGDEDCLFLNVFTQEGGPAKKSVLVMIHGGGFMWGTSQYYGPDYIMDRPDIVYVSINYRVGPLGFLSTGDNIVPGNNGLKDQVAALEWVQRNIANFGGDPLQVTISGLSAGGVSVDFMYLTPLTDGLFQRGYSYSGSSICSWPLVTDGVQKTQRLAQQLGCPTSNSKVMIKCLRRRPARQIVDQVRTFQSWLFNPYTVFGPVVEVNSSRPYIDKHPREIFEQGLVKDLPWIAGVTTEDGLYPAADYIASEPLMTQLQKDWKRIGPLLLFPNSKFSQTKQSKIAEKVKNHYMGTAKINFENREGLLRLMSERLFIAGVAEAAALRYKVNKSPVYLYFYGYQASSSFSEVMSGTTIPLGCSHGDDAMQTFYFNMAESHRTEDDQKMAKVFKDILFTFTTKGVVPEYLKWSPVSSGSISKLNYLKIDSPTAIKMSKKPLGDLEYLADLFEEKSIAHDEL